MEIETALDIITEDYDDADYEVIEDMVDDGHVKHDTTAYYSIVLRKSDNTYWKIRYHTSYNYGFDEHSVDVSQVEKAEVVQTIWKVVK
jgi:hypothetical protein